LDEMIEALDTAFDNACSPAPGSGAGHANLRPDEEASIQELFAEITAAYAVPLKSLIFELHRHTATRDSIEFCRPILRSIRGAAEKINLPEIVHRMEALDQCLALAQAGPDRYLEGEIRDQILSKYNFLAEILPEGFRVGEESRKCEDIIIHSLLQEIPGVGCVTFEKLYQSGLGSLRMLFMGNPEDLAAASGIRRQLCEKICLRMQQYREEAERRAGQPSQLGYRSRLVELVTELRKLNVNEKRGNSPSSVKELGVEKRERRKQRIGLLQEVNVTLAELGELDLIRKLEKVSFKRRICLLDEHLLHWKIESS
ncbi:MAG TPA: helix-hairpin-helix domain-containing protein, partial [Terriglobia bacterium]|nr:helix-hairpin-helix domain-containing protein [Terriglobia bacterium]